MLGLLIWEGIVAYGKLDKEKILLVTKMLTTKKAYMENFDRKWCSHFILCAKDNHNIRWNY